MFVKGDAILYIKYGDVTALWLVQFCFVFYINDLWQFTYCLSLSLSVLRCNLKPSVFDFWVILKHFCSQLFLKELWS